MISALNAFQRFKMLGARPVIQPFLLMGKTPFLHDSGNLPWQFSFGDAPGLYVDERFKSLVFDMNMRRWMVIVPHANNDTEKY
jgi:hypothetical protein